MAGFFIAQTLGPMSFYRFAVICFIFKSSPATQSAVKMIRFNKEIHICSVNLTSILLL
jgi:hypothetical protein